jgi:hypothetical protein
MSHQQRIDDIVNAHRMKVLRNANRHRPALLYGEVPPCVRPTLVHSRQGAFLRCLYRRRGYLLEVDPKQLMKLDNRELLPQTKQTMENHWLRGTPWAPIVIEARWLVGRFLIESNPDYPIALFLAECDVPLVRVQLLEEGDPPAEQYKAASLFANGLHSYTNGWAPVFSAEVAL